MRSIFLLEELKLFQANELVTFINRLVDLITKNMLHSIEAEKSLEAKEIRPTAMRILIYKLLNKSNKALALSDLENAFSNSERTTLFRTLKTFEEKYKHIKNTSQIDINVSLRNFILSS